MSLFFRSNKKGRLKRVETRLFRLVERKERKELTIDDYGRNLYLSIRDNEFTKTDHRYKKLIKEAQKYVKLNESYFAK